MLTPNWNYQNNTNNIYCSKLKVFRTFIYKIECSILKLRVHFHVHRVCYVGGVVKLLSILGELLRFSKVSVVYLDLIISTVD